MLGFAVRVRSLREAPAEPMDHGGFCAARFFIADRNAYTCRQNAHATYTHAVVSADRCSNSAQR